jgi:hypothetical protein
MSAICVTAVDVTVLFFWHPPNPKTSTAAHTHTEATPKHPFILFILIILILHT